MKLLFSLFFFLISFKSSTQELLWVKFNSERGKCSLNQNYLKLKGEPILRVEMFNEPERYDSITDYFWLRQKYIYQFEFHGLDLFLVKKYLKTDVCIWELHVETIEFAIIK